MRTRMRRGARSPPASTESSSTCRHGYLPWQFLSPLYNHRSDRWGGSYENRLRFPLEALHRIRAAIGEDAFLGYRINSTSFWPGDLEIDDIKRIVADLEARARYRLRERVGRRPPLVHPHADDLRARLGARVYAGDQEVSTKPVLLVGRITKPGGRRRAARLGRRRRDPARAADVRRRGVGEKAREGRSDDIRRCVAANYCWRSVIRGGRVQCVYNPVVGRERALGRGHDDQVGEPKRVLVIGAGPAGLEYARVAAARGHEVVVLEREEEVGGHVRAFVAAAQPAAVRARSPLACRQARGTAPRSAAPADGRD